MLNEYQDILTIADVQEILGIGKNAAYQLCRDHAIDCFRIKRTWKIPKISVCEYIEKERKRNPNILGC